MLKIQSFTVNMFAENTYILYDSQSRDAVLIDCGALYEEEQQAIANFVRHHQLHLHHLLTTHAHLDHIFGNQWAKEQFGLSPQIPADEQEFYAHADEQCLLFFGKKLALDLPQPTRLLHEGDEIKFGKHHLHVIACPGHSPGGLCFYSAQSELLISGDSLFCEGIGRTDLPGGNHLLLLQSVRDKLLTLPSTTHVYPGHGSPSTIAHEIAHNPYF